jgi:hypothetical protein
MNKHFARQLIERPDEQTQQQLYAGNITGIFWVDWREADDDIVAAAGAAMGGDALAPEWIDGQLHIRYRGTAEHVPLAFQPGDQDITLLALNRALAPDFEIRCVKASDGGDTLAFMVLDRAAWTELEAAFGARVADAFARIEAGAPFFAPATPPAQTSQTLSTQPSSLDRLRSTISTRLREGLAFAKEKKSDQAIAVFDELDQRYGQEADSRIREYIAMALAAKGDELSDQQKPREAMDAYRQVSQRFGEDKSAAARDTAAYSLFRESDLWKELGTADDVIAAIDRLFARFAADADARIRQTVISALRNKANQLGKLNRLPEQIATYDQMVQHFGDDSAATIRAEVALARNGAAYCRLMQAKQSWADAPARTAALRRAVADLRLALEACDPQWKVMVLGNLGYALFLTGDELNAARETQECLRLGGADALNGQRSDAAAHRLPVEDTAYEDMLTRLWGKLQAGGR